MPIYEYTCPKCGSFDAIQGVNDKPLKAKPDCQDKKCPCKAERVMSAAAFHLKGGGWYKDGYGGSSSKSDSSTKDSGKADSSSSSEGGSKTLKSRAGDDSPKCGSGCKCH